MTNSENSTNRNFRRALREAAAAAEMTESTLPQAPPALGRRRRGGRPLFEDEINCFSLVNVDGILEWREDLAETEREAAPRRFGPRRRATRRGTAVSDIEVVDQLPFAKLAPNQVTQFLTGLDDRLTPHQGFFQVAAGGARTPTEAPLAGKSLVLIHGTFSDPERFVEGLQGFLPAALNHYEGRVYVFGHPTLSVSPLENAIALAHLFRDSQAEVDVVAHSRGGLVTRWWFEGVWRGAAKPGRAILVGSPLAGTSLASPARIRETLSMLTNFANTLTTLGAAASTVMPIMTFVTGMLKLVGSFTSLMAHTPIADAAIAMVPGLSAQSRVGNQPSLLLLRKHFNRVAPPQYHIVSADFEPAKVPIWRFWERFTLLNAADKITNQIFDAPNDLVVDTASMSDFADKFSFTNPMHLVLPRSDQVYHTNYFEQANVIEFMSETLLVPPQASSAAGS